MKKTVAINRLWLGTGNGVIISVPLSAPNSMGKSSSGNLIADVIEKSKPGAPVRVYSDHKVNIRFYLGSWKENEVAGFVIFSQ